MISSAFNRPIKSEPCRSHSAPSRWRRSRRLCHQPSFDHARQERLAIDVERAPLLGEGFNGEWLVLSTSCTLPPCSKITAPQGVSRRARIRFAVQVSGGGYENPESAVVRLREESARAVLARAVCSTWANTARQAAFVSASPARWKANIAALARLP
jgi:hypothetical protein